MSGPKVSFIMARGSTDKYNHNLSQNNNNLYPHIHVHRDGEELDELLERQADMIRYLQQHNASLGRRIMELQARTVE